jgi:hypothetical protein
MSKDSHKMAVNWLVWLFGSTSGSAVARVGVMSTGCGIGELRRGFITKVAGFRLAIGIEMWWSLIGVVV